MHTENHIALDFPSETVETRRMKPFQVFKECHTCQSSILTNTFSEAEMVWDQFRSAELRVSISHVLFSRTATSTPVPRVPQLENSALWKEEMILELQK